jgi:hypothetical protein
MRKGRKSRAFEGKGKFWLGMASAALVVAYWILVYVIGV